jgi:uncharacterized protein YndB with AHSA1/START domain
MSKPEFIYTTYIETTPEKLWLALTDGDFTERYWFGHRVASAWEIGSPYKFSKQDKTTIAGKVLAFEPPKRLSYTWDNQSPDLTNERSSRVTFDIEPRGKVVKLTVTHDNLDEGGKTFRDISGGWPMVLASLKSLLETGQPLPPMPSPAAQRNTDA